MRQVFETKNLRLYTKYTTEFVDEVIKRTTCEQTRYNIKPTKEGYFFEGYPQGDSLK